MSNTLTPNQLPYALADEQGLRILSLDCFDTLLWRDTYAPGDVFKVLEGVTPAQRRRGESIARKARAIATAGKSGEVTLREIYAALTLDGNPAAIDALVAAEIAAEARHCFAFAPTVALMRDAKWRGLKIIVVSDTYLMRDQLVELLRLAAGDEVVGMIDQIFCSCEHRTAKGDRLFDVVLRNVRAQPGEILHIGDNPNADLAAAKRHGLRARHLVQFSEQTIQRLRQEAAAGAVLMSEGAAFQPHRAALALGEPVITDPVEALGYSVLGPVMAGFADWVDDEAREIESGQGGRVHRLYLMRDGHLPAEAAEASGHDAPSHRIEISRFTSTAASLCTEQGVRDCILEDLCDEAGRYLLRQLLLTPSEIDAMLAKVSGPNRAFQLADTLLSPVWLKQIVSRGRAFADRLIEYVQGVVGAAPGDTLMLVDIGYNGSVQNRVHALLTERLQTRVVGRYLLLLEETTSGLDKSGFIDQRRLDEGALQTLVSSASVLEQLCTATSGSVIDYDEGQPIRADSALKGGQSVVRDRIQAGALRFVRAHRDAVLRPANPARQDCSMRGATAALGRLMTLPLPHELDVIRSFEHDVNLGTDQTVKLFDPDVAAKGMRRGGLLYMKSAHRMFLPAELRGQGLPVSLTHLIRRRFSLDLRYVDFCDSTITVPLLIADGARVFPDTVTATPTHEGYWVAAVPIGAGRLTIGLQFGQLFEWLQIDSAEFLPVRYFLSGSQSTDKVAIPAVPTCEGIEQVASHLFRCDANGFLMVPPVASDDKSPMMLSVVFRPIVAREAAPIAEPVSAISFAGAMQ